MTENVLNAWQIDTEARINGINQHNSTGCKVNAREISTGVAYKDDNVTVVAFAVRHEEMIDLFGYRFETPGRTIVISGDTAPAQTIVDHGRGCDVLIHEAYSMATYHQVSSRSQRFRRHHHTSSVELAEIANTVRPGLLVIYHRSNAGGGASSADREDVLLEEIRRDYGGAVVAAHDLDVF